MDASRGGGQVSQENGESGISNDEALSLLTPDIDAFYADIPVYITPLSNTLTSAVDCLRTIANPDDALTEPTTTSTPKDSRIRTRQSKAKSSPSQSPISPHLAERLSRLHQTQLNELPTSRRQMAAVAAEVLATRAQVLERTVVLLERTKHGALTRATKTKAENLATGAENIQGKLKYVFYSAAQPLNIKTHGQDLFIDRFLKTA